MTDNGINDEEAIESILQSDNLRKLLKSLVNEEMKSRGTTNNALERLSDLLSKMNSGNTVSSELSKQATGPIIVINDLRGEHGVGYTQEERQMRCQLASLYRLMDLHGWTLNIYNHITLRNNGDADEFLINPMGLLYREITASSLIKINIEGETLDPGSSIFGINKAGWSLHSALHSVRPDITCVIHTHVPDVIAVSCLKYGLLPLSPEAVDLLDESVDSLSRGVKYHEYWGLAVSRDEWPSLKQDLGQHSKILFLRNHGLAVLGTSAMEAWVLLKRTVQACEHQVRLLQTKGEEGLLSMDFKKFDPVKSRQTSMEESQTDEDATATTVRGTNNANDDSIMTSNSNLRMHRITTAELEFEAMMRMLDNAGYHTGYQYSHGNLLRKGGNALHNTTQHLLEENNHGINLPNGNNQNHNLFDDTTTTSAATMANITNLSLDTSLDPNKSSNVTEGDKKTNQVLASKHKAAQRNQWLIKTMSPEQTDKNEPNLCAGDWYDESITCASTILTQSMTFGGYGASGYGASGDVVVPPDCIVNKAEYDDDMSLATNSYYQSIYSSTFVSSDSDQTSQYFSMDGNGGSSTTLINCCDSDQMTNLWNGN